MRLQTLVQISNYCIRASCGFPVADKLNIVLRPWLAKLESGVMFSGYRLAALGVKNRIEY